MNKARIVFCYLIVKGTNHKSIPNFEAFFNENGMPSSRIKLTEVFIGFYRTIRKFSIQPHSSGEFKLWSGGKSQIDVNP